VQVNGESIIATSGSGTTEVDDNGVARFRIAMNAPREPGTYDLEVVYGEQMLANRELSVRHEK
jgi:hypothetical protein